MNGNQGGGNKKQGLPPTIGRAGWLSNFISSNSGGYFRGIPAAGPAGPVGPVVNYPFTDKAELVLAVDLWINDKPAAILKYGQIDTWDTSAVDDMSELFDGKTTFNDDISNWDTANVTRMESMFEQATAFNNGGQPLPGDQANKWNTSSVTNMNGMFGNAVAFNQDISSWNTGSVTNMAFTFYNAIQFNQYIQNWSVQATTNLLNMFLGATKMRARTPDPGDTPAWNVYFNI
jgi:surface protein